jgi:D-alanyl-D-alanine carboxypeptidase/D-alanyl-D-alanine-endopeptidase (penicillin-binding protein 4)
MKNLTRTFLRRELLACVYAVGVGIMALVAAPAVGAREFSLPDAVAQALADAHIPLTNVGVVVQEIGAASPVLAVNAERPLNPASVMKLVTTYAALELLGPAYTWRTEAHASGNVAGATLAGDLYLKGSGDAGLTIERFWLLLRELRSRSVRRIRGDLVLDRTRFAPMPHDPGAFDGEPYAAYNVGADALLLNFNVVRLRFSPNSDTDTLSIVSEPRPVGLDIASLVKLVSGPCGDWKDGIRADLVRHGRRARLVLTGTFAATCGDEELSLSVLDHSEFVLGVFRQLWSELGGTLDGDVREGTVPPGIKPLAAIESPSLTEVVRDINKFSNNVMARQLFLTLGAEHGHVPASEADGAAAVLAWLKAKGLTFPELELDNGAGLSRRERISAASLARLLQAAYRSPVMPEFLASLPVLAVDGTMRRRLNAEAIAGHAHIKSGTLNGVKTMAGYVLDQAGRRWVVVFLVNDANAVAVRPAQDALLRWVYGGG